MIYQTRRDFLKNAGTISAGLALTVALPYSAEPSQPSDEELYRQMAEREDREPMRFPTGEFRDGAIPKFSNGSDFPGGDDAMIFDTDFSGSLANELVLASLD